jgi:hypothetical protein
MGAKRYGPPRQREKRLLIFDTQPYRYQRFISDLAGMDIHAHGGQAERALVETRHWLTNVSRRQLLGEQELLTRFRTFRAELPAMAIGLNLDPLHITYVDFELILAGWLESHARLAGVVTEFRQRYMATNDWGSTVMPRLEWPRAFESLYSTAVTTMPKDNNLIMLDREAYPPTVYSAFMALARTELNANANPGSIIVWPVTVTSSMFPWGLRCQNLAPRK